MNEHMIQTMLMKKTDTFTARPAMNNLMDELSNCRLTTRKIFLDRIADAIEKE